MTTNLQKKTLGDGDSCLGESGGILDVDVENVDVEIGLGRTKFRNKFLGLPLRKVFFPKADPSDGTRLLLRSQLSWRTMGRYLGVFLPLWRGGEGARLLTGLIARGRCNPELDGQRAGSFKVEASFGK